MKKKIVIIILLILVILMFPIPFHLKDGGTVEYKALTYKISKVHKLDLNKDSKYKKGTIIEIFGIEVYNDVK